MHENMSPLYRTLYEARGTGKIAGERYGYSSQFGGAAQRYIDKATAEARARGEKITGYRPLNYRRHRSDRTYTINVPIYGLDPKRAAEDLRKEQARLAGIQQQQYEKQQASLAEQLKIIQGEKSAVSKMTQEYTNMLAEEAERRRKAQEEAQIAAQTAAANRIMEGRSANLQIQGAGSVPRTAGTAQFRRRALQQGTASPYKGLSTIASGMVNV